MKIAIIGNGRSRDLFKPDDYDLTLGCNLPADHIEVDYTVLVDAKAVCLAFRRTEGKAYTKLVDGKFKLVLGPRAASGSKKTKADPGGKESVFEDLKEKGFVHAVIKLWEDANEIGQRYFSAGHLAFAYANNEYENADIHLFGFDSIFTGYQASYSDELRGKPVTQVKRKNGNHSRENPVNTVGEWYNVWEKILESKRNKSKSITIHGFIGDEINDFFKKYFQIKHYPKDKTEKNE